jgi:RNA polymerase sigma-70 factor (ECF subfamily)
MWSETVFPGVSRLLAQRQETAVSTDEQLMLACQQGQVEVFAMLVERYHSPLLGYLYRLTGGERPLAEDLVQEAFLRTIAALRHYRYPQPFKPWLYAIATNLARDYYKRAETRYTETAVEDSWHDTTPSPSDIVLAQDEAQRVATALFHLPLPQRETLILRYYQDLSLQEIGEVLQIPTGTVKSRLSIGLKRLKELLE